MNNKGFTLIETMAVVVIIGIVTIIANYNYGKYLKNSAEKSFNIAVNTFKDSLISAYDYCESDITNNSFCTNHKKPSLGNEDVIRLSELIDNQFVEKIRNPYNTKEDCNGISYIIVTGTSIDIMHKDQGDSTETKIGTEDSIDLKICLMCGNHSGPDC